MATPDNEHLWQLLSQKVNFLRSSDAYEEPHKEVTCIETHMSWVFLTDLYAYKLKKPVDLHFLDFTSLERRVLNCQIEVQLNQVLAPHYYLGLEPLKQDKSGKFMPIGTPHEGIVVDCLVKMRRFPQEATLENCIKSGSVDMSVLQDAAKRLINFYQHANYCTQAPGDYFKKLSNIIEENYHQLCQPNYELPVAILRDLHAQQRDLLKTLAKKIEQRSQNGHIIECHGDLRPEHICLLSPPIFVDRLEFSRELRIMDSVEELCYLAMECTFLHAPEIGQFFLEQYFTQDNDHVSPQLMQFYQSVHAGVRAKISAWHLDDPHVMNLEKWHHKSYDYLVLANETLG